MNKDIYALNIINQTKDRGLIVLWFMWLNYGVSPHVRNKIMTEEDAMGSPYDPTEDWY